MVSFRENKKIRIIFAGSPAIAVPSLEALFKTDGIVIAGVLTNPDSPKGRSGRLQPTEAGEAAMRLIEKGAAFPVLKPAKLGAAVREELAVLKPDLLVSFAYGHIFGPKFLSLFPLGGINAHPSLLPKYRGPSPIQAAILNRDSITGLSIQRIAPEIDSGNLLAVQTLPLSGAETASFLSEVFAKMAAQMLPDAVLKIASGDEGIPQDHSSASFCKIVKKEDGMLDWSGSAAEIEARIRAFTPWPLCRTFHKKRELFILKASVFMETASGTQGKNTGEIGLVLGINNQYGILIQTGEGILAVSELQYSGKKALFWKDFLNGARDFIGANLWG